VVKIEKSGQNGAFWSFRTVKSASRKSAENGAFKIIDNSRLSIAGHFGRSVRLHNQYHDNIVPYRIEISTANENGQTGPTI